jgi:hypothetical protein
MEVTGSDGNNFIAILDLENVGVETTIAFLTGTKAEIWRFTCFSTMASWLPEMEKMLVEFFIGMAVTSLQSLTFYLTIITVKALQ